MSLDVYLTTDTLQIKKPSSGIFVREHGRTVEITQEKWNRKHPGHTPVIYEQVETETTNVFSSNITHNLNDMATEAGIYQHLWRPEEINITTARELIEPLRQGLHNLKSEPERYKKFNPVNGWGDYEGLVKFVETYLNACYEYPNAKVSVDR